MGDAAALPVGGLVWTQAASDMGLADSMALSVRDAATADAASLASLFPRGRPVALPGLRDLYAESAIACRLADVLMRDHRVRAATTGGQATGYLGHAPDAGQSAMVFRLYLDPAWRHRGMGSPLLRAAIPVHDAPLLLTCFARNAGGRAFNEAHGFRLAALRDGAANEEGEADIVHRRDAGPVLPIPREDMP